ncbi:hypothetical protein [Streptacidiphilus fuscans]|uniref:Uncharacterized protein n=1 Tax=Streptacidiphilus fuscans TaxID=2789292 RepID=A0A931FEA3_9ACTN|nr:hypothetical protein [Streptacidiphilus fuscans]MBF9071537.1 hypothetical protein [Streptacidiphilus fuscans]
MQREFSHGLLPKPSPIPGRQTSFLDAFWAAAPDAHKECEGTRALSEVLLPHRQLPVEAVIAGIKRVLSAGSGSPEVVVIEARKAMEAEHQGEQ